MWKNRILYLLFLAGMLVFYINYNGWISLFVLIFTLALPVFSLLCSLPGMLGAAVSLEAPARCCMGDEAAVTVRLKALARSGPMLCVFRLLCDDLAAGTTRRERMTVSRSRELTLRVDTEHCGAYAWRLGRCRVCDMMGLFSFPVRRGGERKLTVFPTAVSPRPAPGFSAFRAVSCRPMRGGGFSEIHEMREYRPGDPMRSVHWKLSAKTDSLIVREPQEVVRRRVIVAFGLYPDRDQNDMVLGGLTWVCRQLLALDVIHEACFTDPRGGGTVSRTVDSEEALSALLEEILAVPVPAGHVPEAVTFPGADWVYRVSPWEEAAHEN